MRWLALLLVLGGVAMGQSQRDYPADLPDCSPFRNWVNTSVGATGTAAIDMPFCTDTAAALTCSTQQGTPTPSAATFTYDINNRNPVLHTTPGGIQHVYVQCSYAGH